MRIDSNITSSTPFYYFLDAIDFIYKKGWVEGNLGSASVLLDNEDIFPYFQDTYNSTEFKLKNKYPELSGRFLLVTGKDVPIKNISKFKFKIHQAAGVIRINFKGDGYRIMWGFEGECKINPFFEEHLLVHDQNVAQKNGNKILIRAYPTYITQYNMMKNIQDKNELSYRLWDGFPEIVNIIPEGVGLIDMTTLNGIDEFRETIINEFKGKRIIVLNKQGIILTAKNWDDAISIIETVEKSSLQAIRLVNLDFPCFDPSYLRKVATRLGVQLNEDVLASVDASNQKNEQND